LVVPEVQAEATVLITTKDRSELLRDAIASVYEQSANVDLIVLDDGSTDGTSALVRSEFPEARLIRNASALGPIVAKNRGASEVWTRILFTLDDDAIFSQPDVVSRTLHHFDHPRVGAVAIPSLDIMGDKKKRLDFVDWAGDQDFPCLATFRGGANAMRIDLFRSLGGYGGVGRQGEETSYCLRMLAAGYVVRAADVPPIFHYPGRSSRNRDLIVRAGARNNLLFAWESVPRGQLVVRLAGMVYNQLRLGLRERRVMPVLAGLVEGFGAFQRSGRRRVSPPVYKLQRELIRAGPKPFSELEPILSKQGIGAAGRSGLTQVLSS